MTVRRQPSQVHLVQDLLRLCFFVLIVAAVVVAVVVPPTTQPTWLDRGGRVLLGVSTEILVIAVLRELVPRPRLGKHIVGVNAAYARWLASTALVDAAMLPVVRFPFWHLHYTRILYLRALGMNVAWTASLHPETIIRDPSLVAIAAGAQLEPGVVLECALHGAGRVRIAPIVVGGGCLVGAHAALMPGATLGHDATVAPGAVLGEGVRVGVAAKIGDGARVERDADLGSYTTIGTGAIVSAGVRVGDRAKVAAGAVVAPNTEIGEREAWAGTPARRVVTGATLEPTEA